MAKTHLKQCKRRGRSLSGRTQSWTDWLAREEDSGYDAWEDANEPSFEIRRRRGLIKHINFAGIAFPIFFGSGNYRDEKTVRERAKIQNKNRRRGLIRNA